MLRSEKAQRMFDDQANTTFGLGDIEESNSLLICRKGLYRNPEVSADLWIVHRKQQAGCSK